MVPLRAFVRDLAAQLLYRAGVTRPRRAALRASIVTFHRVLPQAELAQYPTPGIAVTPDELAWFLDFFQRYFQCGTLRDTMDAFIGGGGGTGGVASSASSASSDSRPLLAITFDDGQRDNHRH